MNAESPLAELICPEPQDRPDLWPWSVTRDEDGGLVIGGIRATDMARDYATPVYVLDLDDLAGRAQVWSTAMAEEFWDGYGFAGGSAYYAAKAMMAPAVVGIVSGAGMGIDTASLGELHCALAAGADPDTVGLHGNDKSDAALTLALQAGERGIGRIVVDSREEVARIAAVAKQHGRRARVMVRVTTGVHAGGHHFIATAHEDQKFGLSLATGAAREVAEAIAANPDLEFLGLHAHIGSQIFDLEAFSQSAQRLMSLVAELAQKGITTEEVDLGGGYAIAYTGADPQPPSQGAVAAALARAVKTACEEHQVPVPRVSIEPGRSTIGPATITLYRVGTIKDVPLEDGGTRRYISVDGGMSDNIRPALYEAKYTATLANRTSTAAPTLCRVVGGHCESGDIVIHDVALPGDIRRGDLLAVPATGAYGHAMASNYNMFPRPGTLGVKAGSAQWVVQPETVDDLMRRFPSS